MMTFVAILCGVLLFSVTFAFIFSERFRKDVTAGEGETEVFGILNAKGATIVVVLALLLGGTLYADSKSSLTIEKIAEIVPEEAPSLAQSTRKDLKALKDAHIAIIKLYFSEKRTDVEQLFEKEWLPKYSDNIVANEQVRDELAKALASGKSDDEVSKLLSALNVAQQRVLLNRRRELVTPINDQEKVTLQQVVETYDRVFEANQTMIDFLNSLN